MCWLAGRRNVRHIKVTEATIQRGAQTALSNGSVRLFRNNVGEAWLGRVVHRDAFKVIIENPRRVAYGLAPGSGDLIGWRSVLITPAMLGRTVAVFASLEAKRPGARPTGAAQVAWLWQCSEAGALAGIFTNTDEARLLLRVPGE